MNSVDRVTTCIEVRQTTSKLTAKVLAASRGKSEVEIQQLLQIALSEQTDLHPTGWYAPPPDGISVLLGSPESGRSKFKSLRNEASWPKAQNTFVENTFGSVYLSPVHRDTGTIGDIDLSFYSGDDPAVRAHILNALETVELATDFAEVGIQFRELHARTQALLSEQGLDNSWTKTRHDPLGTNLGHTVPWSHEDPTPEEAHAIATLPMQNLKEVISHKRRYVNAVEDFIIPETIAFTLEAQCTSATQPELPNAFFHAIITFRKGEKQVVTGFNPIFAAVGADYLRSRF